MQRQLGAIFLVAGTAIGSGTLALPMVLAKLGLVASIVLMLCVWGLVYYTALMSVELNLHAKKGLPLGPLARRFSGPIAEWIGIISLKVLSYALLAVYIYGGAAVIQKLLSNTTGQEISFVSIASFYTVGIALILASPIRWVDYVNRLLFIGLLGVFAILVAGLGFSMEWGDLPLTSESTGAFQSWHLVIPVVFTSFGFQVIFHTLTDYCRHNPAVLRRVFFWGSGIPTLIYIIWTCSVLGVLYHHNPLFYQQAVRGTIDVGDMINALSHVAQWKTVQLLAWWVSILAILTSVIGVGLGLIDTIKHSLERYVKTPALQQSIAIFAALIPAYIIAIMVPNAFIKVLGFAGMILTVIAILLPVYLLMCIKGKKLFYEELHHAWLHWIAVAAGVGIIVCELLNMM